MDSPLEDQHRIVSGGNRPVKRDNFTEQSSKDPRTVSVNESPDGAFIGPSTDKKTEFRGAGGHNEYASNEQNILYSGYGSSSGAWDGYSQYANADGLNVVSPVMFNDSPSVVFHSGYGFNPDGSYGQYSPVATPIAPLMLEGQLYSTQQLPFSPSYYPQQATPGLPHVSSPFPVSATELMGPESSNMENRLYSPGSGYLVNFGSFGGGSIPGNLGSGTLPASSAYPPPMGILGSYNQNISQQQRPVHGFGLVSSAFTGHYPQSGTNRSLNYGGTPISYLEQSCLNLDKGRQRERDRDSVSLFSDSNYFSNDRNRGPRSSKVKEKGAATEQGPSFDMGKNDASSTRIYFDLYNSPDLATDYENAKFFIIKSFSEDNVHKSVKYKVWASTPHGNKKLDAAYHEAKAVEGRCPIFLFFSVNASGQFCGVAEMVGPVDFEKSANYWQQDRWSGQFPVQWHIVKDVPNIRFRHIILENNDNKPVTHSRDSQEVKLKHGIEMLKIFKEHDTRTSILDDFDFYDEREKMLKERKARQQPYHSKESPNIAADTINSLSDSFSQATHLDACGNEESDTEERVTEQRATSRANAPYLFEDPINQTPDQISQVMWSDRSKKEGLDSSTGIGH